MRLSGRLQVIPRTLSTLAPSLGLCLESSSSLLQSLTPLGQTFSRNKPIANQASYSTMERTGDVCIVSAVRTPLGAFQGALASLTAPELGSVAIRAALERIQLDPAEVQEVFFGNVVSAGVGQAPARQAALLAGLPPSVVCTTVNKVCSSGLKSVMLAALTIKAGINDVVVAGGMESMSNIPYALPGARTGLRMGHGQVTDLMINDGLWDPYGDMHMGNCAEQCAEEFGFTREQQDDHAVSTHERACAAIPGTANEIVPVLVPGKRGRPAVEVSQDEALGKMDVARLRGLRAAFSKAPGASVTAGNSSPITDGAAALVLMSSEKAAKLGLKVLAHVSGMGDAEQEPHKFPTTPALAIPIALRRAGISLDQVDFFEINQAFSVVELANCRLLGLSDSKVNVNGGAVALGHPIGASGAVILVRLINVLHQRGAKVGVAAICNGGGGASAVVIRRTYTDGSPPCGLESKL